MEPIAPLNLTLINEQLRQLTQDEDVTGLRNLVNKLKSEQSGLMWQAQREESRATEMSRNARIAGKLALSDPTAARQQFLSEQADSELHLVRARELARQAQEMKRFVADVQRIVERFHAKVLSREIVARAQALRTRLDEAKAALGPLHSVIQSVYELATEIEMFNNSTLTVKLPMIQLYGDPNVLSRLTGLKIGIPEELEQIAGQESGVS